MGLDVGCVHDPHIAAAVFDDLLQLARDEARIVADLGGVVGGLQVVEAGMEVDAVLAVAFRHGRNTWVPVLLTTGNHAAEAVVGPDLDDVLRVGEYTLAVQVHRLAVQVDHARGTGVGLLHEVVLALDDVGQQLAARLVGRVARIVVPERLIALAAEAKGPYGTVLLAVLDAGLPQCLELVLLLRPLRLQARVSDREHLRAQRAGMVLVDVEAHATGKGEVRLATLAGTRDDHVATQAVHSLEGETPRLLLVVVDVPILKQHLVVDEEALVTDRGRLGFGREIIGHLDLRNLLETLVIPEPEVLDAEQFTANVVQSVNEAEIITGMHFDVVAVDLDLPCLVLVGLLDEDDACARLVARHSRLGDITLDVLNCEAHRFGNMVPHHCGIRCYGNRHRSSIYQRCIIRL